MVNAFDDTASVERKIAVDCFIFLIWVKLGINGSFSKGKTVLVY